MDADHDALVSIKLRRDFYRDGYRRAQLLCLILAVIIVIETIALSWVNTRPPQVQYFATDPEGKLTKMHPLNQPLLSQEALLSWANQSIVSAYTYNFVDYRKQLQTLSSLFTPDGWKQFQAALVRTRNLETVIAKQLVTTAVATGAPIIEDQRVINGRYSWRISMPILVKYQSSSQNYSQSLVVRIIVQRVPVYTNPKGIAIVQFIAQ
ncbi:MAG: type IV secretion protein DotI [Legionellales bacterium]|nr:type IV secretion protein DotI [Legionellales bacterium]